MTEKMKICDDCSMIAYDNNLPSDAMFTLGDIVEDHICSMREDPEAFIGKCSCPCNR
jgi:hypothetical protein